MKKPLRFCLVMALGTAALASCTLPNHSVAKSKPVKLKPGVNYEVRKAVASGQPFDARKMSSYFFVMESPQRPVMMTPPPRSSGYGQYASVRTTAYCHDESDHLIYGRMNAVGTMLKYGNVRSAAADWSRYPVGTRFRIASEPEVVYVVDDYGSALVGTGTIDIYQPNKKLMKEWGRRYVELTIVRWGDPANSLEVLGSRRGYRHCRAMYAALQHRVSKGFYAKAD